MNLENKVLKSCCLSTIDELAGFKCSDWSKASIQELSATADHLKQIASNY